MTSFENLSHEPEYQCYPLNALGRLVGRDSFELRLDKELATRVDPPVAASVLSFMVERLHQPGPVPLSAEEWHGIATYPGVIDPSTLLDGEPYVPQPKQFGSF